MGRAFVKEVFQRRETMEVGDVGIEGSDIYSRQMVLGGRGMGRDQMILRKWLVSFV